MEHYAKLRKLMWTYLDMNHPTVYIKETVFGDCLSNFHDDYISRREMIKELVKIFTCDEPMAELCLHSWISSRPRYKSVRNSTNPHVLIAKFE